MTVTAGVVDERDDAALIRAVRDGDTEAYGVLFERHVDAARRLARALARPGDADDLVAEAFAKVLPVLARGEGPEIAFRPYLLTALRRLDLDRHRSLSRTRPTDDAALLEAGLPPAVAAGAIAEAEFESAVAGRAFASLPERWQAVLWHTEVEGQRPAEVAPLLGLSPNAVSQLAHRAREGLRRAFVSMHVQEGGEQRSACRTTRANLGSYIRAGLSHREAARVSAHLECCRPCTAVYLELVEVDTGLRALLAPVVLGGAAAAYLADIPVASAPSAIAFIGELVRTGTGKVLAGTTTAGVLVTAFVLGGAVLVRDTPDRGSERQSVADAPVLLPPPSSLPAHRRDRQERPAPSVTPAPSAAPTAAPAQAISSTAPEAPSEQEAQQPSQQPAPPGDQQAQEPTHQQPDHGPTHHPQPTHDATPGPTPDPTPSVADPERPLEDPTAVDIRVSASAAPVALASVVTIEVAGLGAGQPGTVTVTGDQLGASLTPDRRCDLIGLDTVTCRMSGSGTVQLVVASLGLLAPMTLTITAAPGPGLHDPAMADNTTRVTLR